MGRTEPVREPLPDWPGLEEGRAGLQAEGDPPSGLPDRRRDRAMGRRRLDVAQLAVEGALGVDCGATRLPLEHDLVELARRRLDDEPPEFPQDLLIQRLRGHRRCLALPAVDGDPLARAAVDR